VGTTNSKPPGPIIMIDQSEILSRNQVQFLTCFFGGAQLCCVGTTNSKPPGPIIVIDQSEILSRNPVQFLTRFFGGAQLFCTFYQPRQGAQISCRKTNFLS
jgi:hypothetical protein